MVEYEKELLSKEIEELKARIKTKAVAIDLLKETQPEIAEELSAEMNRLKGRLTDKRMLFFQLITQPGKV
ncbi:hypothetical protein [Arcticibacter sp. MXS-1]|uniref:hypothetical protein n=1 Tax=Arcticibacter sp. MXS-1 TaxID=3341726 RepID=UPI0035A90717